MQHFKWPPPRRKIELAILVPSSILRTYHHLREKTFVAGLIARAAAIFRINKVVVYKDPESRNNDFKVLVSVLRYLREPPYLRKHTIPITKELRYAGILPPLATPNHPKREEVIEPGSIREGVLIEKGGRLRAFIGLSELCEVEKCKRTSGKVLVKIVSIKPLKCVCIDESEVPNYMCYELQTHNTLSGALRAMLRSDYYIIMSTKKGEVISEVLGKLKQKLRERRGLAIVFGSPNYDPDEIVALEGQNLSDILTDFIELNSAPLQGVRTIRSYEAVFITLTIISNALYALLGGS